VNNKWLFNLLLDFYLIK